MTLRERRLRLGRGRRIEPAAIPVVYAVNHECV